MQFKQKTDSRTLKTYEELSKALTTLLSKYNYKYITVQQICNLANVHRTTFYKHFKDVDDLTDYMILSWVKESFNIPIDLTGIIGSKNKLLYLIKVGFNDILKHNVFIKEFESVGNWDLFYQKAYGILIKDADSFFSSANISNNYSSELAKNYIVSGIFGTAVYWFKNPDMPINELMNQIDNLIPNDMFK